MSTRKGKATQNGGPRTPAGKLRASHNARKHGLFAAGFIFSEIERSEFDDLKCKLWKELRPNSVLLEVVCEDLLASAWQMKLALRCERTEVRKQLKVENEENRMPPLDDRSRMEYPYSLLPSELRPRLKLLQDLRSLIEEQMAIPAELKNPVIQAFGPDFCNTPTEWTPTNPTLLHMMVATLEKCKTFGWEPPEKPPTPQEESKYIESDSLAGKQMMLKLVELETQHLRPALHHVQRTEDDGTVLNERADRLDLFIRYHTTARRDFYRALHEYRDLKGT